MSQATKMGVTNLGGIQSSRVVRDSFGTTWKTIRPWDEDVSSEVAPSGG